MGLSPQPCIYSTLGRSNERGQPYEDRLMAVRADTTSPRNSNLPLNSRGGDQAHLRMALNLLTEDPRQPSGAHWCWTRIVPEMASRLVPGEQLYLMVSPAVRHFFPDLGDSVQAITFPWSNERRLLRTASEHVMTPFLLPRNDIDLLSTAIAPIVNPTKSLVIHMKTMHAYSAPESIAFGPRTYRRLNYQRSVRLADAVVVNSNSLRAEVDKYLKVDPKKVSLIYEAVDHEIFKPGSTEAARRHVSSYGVSRPFVLFVSSMWRYKNCDGLLRAWRLAQAEMGGRQLVIVGPERDEQYGAELHQLVEELGIAEDVVFVGAVPNEETVQFYRAADVLVYPSFNETFGLPILEAMASNCPVVTSNISSMPEIAGGAAVLVDPHDPGSIAKGILDATGSEASRLRADGIRQAQKFTWSSVAAATLDVYREAAERRKKSS
jgi:glycosyltransferase involved in cell wall biosynthesis